MLRADQLERFDRDGFIRVRAAFDGAEAMADRLWTHLAARHIDRDDPATWPEGAVHHLQGLRCDPVFAPIGGPPTTVPIDDLLGAGRWTRPRHWGQFLVSFPERGRRWILPSGVWHSDAAYTEGVDPLLGVLVFSFLSPVKHQGGGTLLVAGSHRLVARFAAGRRAGGREKSAATRKAFYRSHPWLTDLVEDDHDPARNERFAAETDVDGLPARVVELVGEPGDVVITHPLIAHCAAPNCADQPRFMRLLRPRVTRPTG